MDGIGFVELRPTSGLQRSRVLRDGASSGEYDFGLFPGTGVKST